MARHVDREQLPADRTVIQFDFRDPAKRYWMVLEPSDVSVCLQHPGFDVDLEVRVDTATLYRVYLGRAELGGAMRAGKLTLDGPRVLQRGFGRWFAWSAFAPASVPRESAGRTAAADVSSLQSVSEGNAVGDARKREERRSGGRRFAQAPSAPEASVPLQYTRLLPWTSTRCSRRRPDDPCIPLQKRASSSLTPAST